MDILVIEDEEAIADFVARSLRDEGFRVVTAKDGAEGERLAIRESIDLVLLDRMLPGRDGLQVLAAIRRAKPALPVILLTARGEVEDKVEGLEEGATDYMAKPFALPELVARVRAHLREAEGADHHVLRCASLRLNLLERTVEGDGGRRVRLADREAKLLAYLMRRSGEVCSREELLTSVWGYDHDPGTNVVQVYIGYLRRRLKELGVPPPIETVRSVGYRLAEKR